MSPTKGKSAKQTLGRKTKTRKGKAPHTKWVFTPKLENEAVVLHSILDVYDVSFYKEIVDDVKDLITQLVRNHGFNDGSVRYKTIKDYTLALVEGRNPDNPGWLATSKVHKIPSQLGVNFIQLLADYMVVTEVALQPKYYQVTNTILNIVRMVDGLVDPDLRSVFEKSKPIDQSLLEAFDRYADKELGSLKKIDDNINLFNYRFHLGKNGPNGVPKLESSIQEAKALLSGNLGKPFAIICEELNLNYLLEYLELLIKKDESDLDPPDNKPSYSSQSVDGNATTRLRVLADVPDSGFKTRVVAIVDFWTQLVLLPFRDHVQAVIEMKFGLTDFRKDQDLGVAKMEEFTERCLRRDTIERHGKTHTLDAKHLKCYDISSWTDRFHRDLQKIVVKNLFNPRVAEAWAQLVVHCDWYHPRSRSTIKYGQGQGMGTNGSFDVATLTSHLFINFIIDGSDIAGLFENNQCYGEVGDDLWIYDPQGLIPKFYEKINLPINFSKSKGFSNGHSYNEFCSRTFRDLDDVSRINPRIISKSSDFRYIPGLLGLCCSRGVQLYATSFESLNRKVKGSESTYFDKLQIWVLSYLMIAQTEESSVFQSLTMEYLKSGNWIGEELLELLNTPALMCRLLIAYSIVTIVENTEAVEDLLFDLVDAMDELSDEIIQMTEEGTNLFDLSHSNTAVAAASFKVDLLSPRQIVVMGRYVDQRRLLRESLVEANDKVMFCEDPMDIYSYARSLSRIASRSCYDQGNINYNIDRVYTRQYKMVKVLERMDSNYTILSGLEAQQLRKIWQTIPYDEIASQWEGYLPTLET